jgi:predicted GNAT superfamily acetyltransferase
MIRAETRPDGLRDVLATDPAPEGPRALLEVPADINRLRALDSALADRWRAAVRRAFQAAFADGFRAVGFLRFPDGGQPCGFYVLHREGE